MNRKTALLMISSTLVAATPAGLSQGVDEAKTETSSKSNKAAPAELIAVVTPTAGNKVRGLVSFKSLGNGNVEVTARLTGLSPHSEHGFHIHQFGDLTASDGSTAGGHFNPKNRKHGLPPKARHAGDLGNLKADAEGTVSESIIVNNFRMTGKHSIVGRAVVIHSKADTGAQPTGEAGKRLGVGVIGYRFEPTTDG